MLYWHIVWYSYLLPLRLPSIPWALTLRRVALLPSPCIFTGTIKGRNVFHAEYKSALRVFHSRFCACQHFSSFFSPLLSCHAFFSHSLCLNHYSLYTRGLKECKWITQGEHSQSYLNILSASVLTSLWIKSSFHPVTGWRVMADNNHYAGCTHPINQSLSLLTKMLGMVIYCLNIVKWAGGFSNS